MANGISIHDQVRIVQFFLEIAELAVTNEDERTLAKLSLIASALLPYVDESDVTLFFDLGEYLDERSQDFIQHRDPRDGWGERALDSVKHALSIAKSVESRHDDDGAA